MTHLPGAIDGSSRWARWARLALLAIGLGVVLAVNLYLAARSISLILGGAPAVDWGHYGEASRRIHAGGLYEVTNDYAFPYSPLLAYAFGPISWLGTDAWRLLHVVAALAMPSWPIRLLAIASWPFWYDVEAGNILVFVVLAASWALRGNRAGIGAFLILTVLVPRPLMLPLAAWLLWHQPAWRVPFVAVVAIHLAAVVATGLGGEWIGALLAARGDVGNPSNIAPSRFIGTLPWMAVGLPLAALLTWRGRLGLASLAASPYWLPYYLLMLLLELPARRSPRDTASPVVATT